MWKLGLLVTLVGCGFHVDLAASADDTSPPATTDGAVDDPCFGTGLVRVCLTTPPPVAYTITGNATIDTDAGGLCLPVTGDHVDGTCVIGAETISIAESFTAIGSKPLVFVATKTFALTGLLDVSSHRGGTLGAGAASAMCMDGAPPGTDGDGGGGGAGGSFTGSGGVGGSGVGAHPGVAIGEPTAVHGGCSGSRGASYDGDAGEGGSGGGAVYVIAAQAIAVTGAINASGQSGQGGRSSRAGGGGGGGSGGMIVLDAPTLSVTGDLFANGGGGGGGADNYFAGGDGGEALTAADTADGGGGAGGGGGGGKGAAGSLRGGAAGLGNTTLVTIAGAGGGGGSAGYIRLLGTLDGTSTISPPAQ